MIALVNGMPDTYGTRGSHHVLIGHTAPWTLWACPECGHSFREGSNEPGGCCGKCADAEKWVVPVRAEGPRQKFDVE